MIKKGDCMLIKPKDKWLCVKYYDHDIDYIRYVPMHIDMLHKQHIKKMKFDITRIRDIHQGRGENPKRGDNQIEWKN